MARDIMTFAAAAVAFTEQSRNWNAVKQILFDQYDKTRNLPRKKKKQARKRIQVKYELACLGCYIEHGEFCVLWRKNHPVNEWVLDGWDGPWMVLKNLADQKVTCRILPKHVMPLVPGL